VAGLDVNDPATITWAATAVGLDADRLRRDLESDAIGAQAQQALADFERVGCPGVPTCVFEGQRFFGKDRVDWLIDRVRARIAAQ
jgi:2-hydroxychromene-2-carboxylate isomerase